ncbi:ATPeF1D [Lepeophtheirus salmonis]|uniref:F-ATPase delta subunit n=1 Tax=Lepeophtheirus salmonis TaxID=72036 RepID=C1BVK2_LEPSM|nr:ATP synthase subunit delta, mitochondrial-like [Lepeophtheirus salmonis]ACO13055.1 ATP synthase subunit delta, mitochondrial precursor [Lepeophtheirus salmonis]ADD38373.1 ATP synthase subunit delta, mitochondrial [Lepeophtheirus salmonis]CAB4056357.1 ATPeF1D [Lepeophtheirus salmonis]CAF2796800.1 ATPeF1D [Lepeophtheirus salmonis]
MSLRSVMLSRRLVQQAMMQRRGYAEMSLTFAAPNGVHYNETIVKQVDIPSFSGSFGILPDHVPSLAVLKPGVISVFEETGDVAKFFVSSGSVTINADSTVQILAEEAHPLADLDPAAAKQALSDAQASLASAASDAEKAEAEIEVETAEELLKALA